MPGLPNFDTPLLTVRDLRVSYKDERQPRFTAVRGVDFSIRRGEVLGLLGESGSGKTSIGMALLRTLPASAEQTGEVCFRGQNLATISEDEMRSIRGAHLSMIFQDPALALSPLMMVGDQVSEVLRAHNGWSGKQSRDLAYALLEELEMGDIERIYRAYPHQLSGGQCQRILIAQALVCKPELVIADEPTASLDAITALEILNLLRRFKQQHSIAFLLISHDPAMVSAIADTVGVMQEGKIVEQGPTDQILNHPRHPYTQALLGARQPMPQLA